VEVTAARTGAKTTVTRAPTGLTPGLECLRNIDEAWELDSDERDFVAGLEHFVADRIAPSAEETDRTAIFPRDHLRALSAMGCNQVFIPAEYGGIGASPSCYLRMVEVLSRGCPSTAISWATTYHSTTPLLVFGSQDQKQRYLPLVASGSIGALAITEESGGSDVRAIRTVIRPNDQDLIIDGAKVFITNGGEADFYIVFGKWDQLPDRDALTALLVEADTPGFEVVRTEKKLGHRASATAEIRFDAVRVPRDNLIGVPGGGFSVLTSALNYSRPSIAAHGLGIARSALEDALEYINERRQFGKRILEFQGVQFMVADLVCRLASAETMLMYVAKLVGTGGGDRGIEASMLKVLSTDLAMDAATAALQLRGGYGYISGARAERLFRDAKLGQIFEGANELHRERIGRSFLQSTH
jgi:acyl-CoA dehydrogenase